MTPTHSYPLRGLGAIRATGAYVLRPTELAVGWLTLYAATFLVQLLCAAFRAIVSYPIIWVIFKIIKQPTTHVHDLSLIAGYAPLALSVATLIIPLGGWWWEQTIGGRAPSEREQLILDDAITTLRQHNPQLRAPRRWTITDEHHANAAVYGDTMMVTRGLLESGYLEAVVAHELGHLNSSDGRLSAALYRLTTPPRKRMPFGLRLITMLATGAAGVWLMRGPWGVYWRARENQADIYAASLGQADALAQFLETEALAYDLPIPFIWLTDTTHPSSEHRIDRLQHHHNPL